MELFSQPLDFGGANDGNRDVTSIMASLFGDRFGDESFKSGVDPFQSNIAFRLADNRGVDLDSFQGTNSSGQTSVPSASSFFGDFDIGSIVEAILGNVTNPRSGGGGGGGSRASGNSANTQAAAFLANAFENPPQLELDSGITADIDGILETIGSQSIGDFKDVLGGDGLIQGLGSLTGALGGGQPQMQFSELLGGDFGNSILALATEILGS